MRRYEAGRAWITGCPVCDIATIEAHTDGLRTRLSTKAIPLEDAKIVQKYSGTVLNVWKGPTQLWVTAWFRDQGKPLKGHLYVPHIHGFN